MKNFFFNQNLQRIVFSESIYSFYRLLYIFQVFTTVNAVNLEQ